MKIFRVIFKSIDADECDNTVRITTFLDRNVAVQYYKECLYNIKNQEENLDLEDYRIDEDETSYERYLDGRAIEDSVSIWLEDAETYDEKYLQKAPKYQSEKDNDYEMQ